MEREEEGVVYCRRAEDVAAGHRRGDIGELCEKVDDDCCPVDNDGATTRTFETTERRVAALMAESIVSIDMDMSRQKLPLLFPLNAAGDLIVWLGKMKIFCLRKS